MQRETDKLIAKAKEDPRIASLFSIFRSNTPQLFADIDRTKVKSMGVSVNDVSQTLQIYLGSLYVNNFNEFGRSWQVNVQADEQFRYRAGDISKLKVRSRAGLYYESFEEFAETLFTLTTNRTLNQAFGENGRTFYEQNYAWPVIERKYQDLLQRIAQPDANTGAARLDPLPGWLTRRRKTLAPAASLGCRGPCLGYACRASSSRVRAKTSPSLLVVSSQRKGSRGNSCSSSARPLPTSTTRMPAAER